MKRFSFFVMVVCFCIVSNFVFAKSYKQCPEFLNFELETVGGKKTNLCEFTGQVILVTNIATQDSFTRQLRAFEDLYKTYKNKGFVVLAFPTKDFGANHLSTNQEIAQFCKRNYGITFPVFAVTSVDKKKGDNVFFKKLYTHIGIKPQWNFYKYFIDKQGRPQKAFDSNTSPKDPRMVKMIESLL